MFTTTCDYMIPSQILVKKKKDLLIKKSKKCSSNLKLTKLCPQLNSNPQPLSS